MAISNQVPSCFLEASARIGSRIVRDAFWHADRCNWVGALPREGGNEGHRPGTVYLALGPELYS